MNRQLARIIANQILKFCLELNILEDLVKLM